MCTICTANLNPMALYAVWCTQWTLWGEWRGCCTAYLKPMAKQEYANVCCVMYQVNSVSTYLLPMAEDAYAHMHCVLYPVNSVGAYLWPLAKEMEIGLILKILTRGFALLLSLKRLVRRSLLLLLLSLCFCLTLLGSLAPFTLLIISSKFYQVGHCPNAFPPDSRIDSERCFFVCSRSWAFEWLWIRWGQSGFRYWEGIQSFGSFFECTFSPASGSVWNTGLVLGTDP